MSKKRNIGRMIHKGVELKKLVTPNMIKAMKRREALVAELNFVIDNVDKKFGTEQVMRAKTALRKLYIKSHALHEVPPSNNPDSWRKDGKFIATGRQKVKRKPTQPLPLSASLGKGR